MTNQPSTEPKIYTQSDYDVAARYLVASFIGWQIAVLNQVPDTEDGVDLGVNIVSEAEANIQALLLGEGLALGDDEVTLDNDTGREMATLLSESIMDTAHAMEAKSNV